MEGITSTPAPHEGHQAWTPLHRENCTHTSQLGLFSELSNDIPVAMNAPNTQNLVCKLHSLLKELCGKWLIPGREQDKYQMSQDYIAGPESKEVLTA